MQIADVLPRQFTQIPYPAIECSALTTVKWAGALSFLAKMSRSVIIRSIIDSKTVQSSLSGYENHACCKTNTSSL